MACLPLVEGRYAPGLPPLQQKDAFAGGGRADTDDAKIGQLERQLSQLTAENITLKKALQCIKELAREKGE